MPGHGDNTQPTMVYPTQDQHARWKHEAEKMDMSLSEFVQAMTEAGIKKFDVTVEPDESLSEVRRQRTDLKKELDRTRERVTELERQLQLGERSTIQEYVKDNPSTTLDEIIQHVIGTASQRAAQQVESMVTTGDLEYEDGEYY